MNPSHVETVFIAGKVRKWRGGLVGVDAQRVRRLMQESRDAVLRRAGFEMNLLGGGSRCRTFAPRHHVGAE
jgi:5-methylthioadenosine/S-adenosylhomocysteine deaminase